MDFARLIAIARQVVAATQNRLPTDVRAAANAVPVCYEPVPNRALQAEGVEPDVLGLFVGDEYGSEFSGEASPLPPANLAFPRKYPGSGRKR